MVLKLTFRVCCLLLLSGSCAAAQPLTLRDAVQTALDNYGTIRAKAAYAKAALANVRQAQFEYLPNLWLSAQQDYGTVNGQNGPLYGFGGLGVASSGIPLAEQNWNAAFGALYLTNLNWDFFAFGRAKHRIGVARAIAERERQDLGQEQFQHAVRVAGTYLNLLASKRLLVTQEKNLDRANVLRTSIVARARGGIIAGVDSSQANAEVSAARIAISRARDAVQEQEVQLAQLMGIPAGSFNIDTSFVQRVPGHMGEETDTVLNKHPQLQYFRDRIVLADEQTRYYRSLQYPAFSLFSVLQTRGSGFSTAYTTDQHAYTQDYFDGINPTRSNYLLGIGVSWNLTNILRMGRQTRAQGYAAQAARDEYDVVDQRLKAQLTLADGKIDRALQNYREAPLQVQAATDAYTQRSVLYKNGLNTIVDLTQALYALNRAETDRDIAYTNVWQALLLKAAAAGDIDLFLNEL